jgi:hypothetical protein
LGTKDTLFVPRWAIVGTLGIRNVPDRGFFDLSGTKTMEYVPDWCAMGTLGLIFVPALLSLV